MRRLIGWMSLLIVLFLGSACVQSLPAETPAPSPAATQPPVTTPAPTFPQPSQIPTLPPEATPTMIPPSPTPSPLVPNFSHVIVIVLENKEFGSVIGNPQMPYFNQLAQENVLLTQYYAVTHPSLPNYLAMIGGSTFDITTDCTDCFVNAPSLPDLMESAGLTWRTYQEDMPSPCFVGSTSLYAQKHNPFAYFDAIRLNAGRCQAGIVPLTQLDTDLVNGDLANFVFITPNECNDAHSCDVSVADKWLENMVTRLMQSRLYDERSLIVLTWDEGQGNHGCCGIDPAGGRVATVLISPLAQAGLQDDTPYTHYSLLKTLSAAWGLPDIGHAADAETSLIVAPWKK